MKTRMFERQDYEIISHWWKYHEIDIVPFDCIPETSYISEDENGPAAFGSLYLTNSSLAFVEHMLTRPFLDKKDRKYHVNIVMDMSQVHCDRNKIKMMCFCNEKKVESFLISNGYVKAGGGMDLWVRPVRGDRWLR